MDLQSVTLRYPARSHPALDSVSLRVEAGETLAVLGPSGCGKSSLLRVIAGLETPQAGRVLIAGRDTAGVPPERRDLALVFQDYALFPHLSVLQNASYGLEEARVPRQEARERALAALETFGLTPLAGRRVHELSGGERQRVALARSLAPSSSLLLLDEPLSNLDERLRDDLRGELLALFARLAATVLLVTHDQREALALSSRLAVMREGRIVAAGSPRAVFEDPRGEWTARFLGHRNVLTAPQAEAGGLEATVAAAVYEGRATRLTLDLGGVPLSLESPLYRPPGENLTLALDAARTVPLEPEEAA